jgi:hypothetical protein
VSFYARLPALPRSAACLLIPSSCVRAGQTFSTTRTNYDHNATSHTDSAPPSAPTAATSTQHVRARARKSKSTPKS